MTPEVKEFLEFVGILAVATILLIVLVAFLNWFFGTAVVLFFVLIFVVAVAFSVLKDFF